MLHTNTARSTDKQKKKNAAFRIPQLDINAFARTHCTYIYRASARLDHAMRLKADGTNCNHYP